ncbi:MAG: HAMP domain-containing histidine kinase [Myxococcales bacterium]|nr:HAMP domain-containing histidine kinase [Myxococcales bacterium]
MSYIRLKLPITLAGPLLGIAVVVMLLVWGTRAAWIDFEQEQRNRLLLYTILELGLETASALVDPVVGPLDHRITVIQDQLEERVEHIAVLAGPSQFALVTDLYGHVMEVLTDVELALMRHPRQMLVALDQTRALPRIQEVTTRSVRSTRQVLAQLETDERGWLATDFVIATSLSITLLLGVGLISWHSQVFFHMNLQELVVALEQALVDSRSRYELDETSMPFRSLLTRVRGLVQQLVARVDADRRSLTETNYVLQEQIGMNQTMEVELHRRNEELERLNAELLEENVRRRRLFADLGHELRTPISAVRGEAEVALRVHHPDVGMLREALALIVDQTEHTAKLLDDLLVLAREESSDLPLACHPVDVVHVVSQALDFVHPLMAERQLRCDKQLPDGRPEVMGDTRRMVQVLLVLLDNACRYTPVGGCLRVHLVVQPKRLVLTVEDEGPGIPEDELPHIFDRFFRGRLAQDARPEGSGLGLSVARALVRRHGGQLNIESHPGSGTRAYIVMPRWQTPV